MLQPVPTPAWLGVPGEEAMLQVRHPCMGRNDLAMSLAEPYPKACIKPYISALVRDSSEKKHTAHRAIRLISIPLTLCRWIQDTPTDRTKMT